MTSSDINWRGGLGFVEFCCPNVEGGWRGVVREDGCVEEYIHRVKREGREGGFGLLGL